jgi:hypothetical protein
VTGSRLGAYMIQLKKRQQRVRPLSVFIHIPKCGGTSITSWLVNEPAVGMRKYYSIREIEENFDNINNSHVTFGHIHLGALLDRYPSITIDTNVFTFTVVRDPLRRFLSLYSYFVANNTIPKIGLKAFLELVTQQARGCGEMTVFYLSQAMPQTYWLLGTGIANIQLVGKLDSLPLFVDALKARYAISSEPSRLNASKSVLEDSDLQDLASEEFQEKFYTFYHKDYDLLGYEVIFAA